MGAICAPRRRMPKLPSCLSHPIPEMEHKSPSEQSPLRMRNKSPKQCLACREFVHPPQNPPAKSIGFKLRRYPLRTLLARLFSLD